jgi:hypothetical protein
MTSQAYRLKALIVAVLLAAAGLFAGLAGAQPIPGAKVPRPAAPGPSPEEQFQKQLPPPAKPEELKAPAQTDMESRCMQNPKCRQKLEQAKQGKRPAKPLPAATEPSPEEKLQKSLPPPAQGIPPQRPRSQVPGPMDWLFSWLDPLTPEQAWAQSGFNLTFTPNSRSSSSPYGYLGLYGGYISGNSTSYTLYSPYSTTQPSSENKPFVFISTSLPAAGYYLIDVVASASLVKLRHQYNGPILETWDSRGGCGSSTCHYVTVDYYAAGGQYWYFWADPTNHAYFYSVTIKSYP